ncbi:MAG: glycoside hydrolase family 16 protein [Clostridium perfringens]|nr:glycoside hydrolase family 16 protein [Clostridium perfringens]
MSKRFNFKKIQSYIKTGNRTKVLILGGVIALIVLWIVIFIVQQINYNFSINKYNSYIESSIATDGVLVQSLTNNNNDVKNIYDKLQSRNYNDFLYMFNLEKLVNSSVQNENIDVTLKAYSKANLNGKILNIYEYNEGSNTFNCLGETKVVDNTIVFKTKSAGKHFLTLVQAPTYDLDNEKLIYNDEFNYKSSLSNNWNYDIGNNDGWGNEEKEYYTDNSSNSYIKDNNLNITAIKESYNGYDYTSARLVSKGNFLYGKFEISAKLPEGDGMWPAIWMLPVQNTYGPWPESGEIDIMESIGRQPNYIRGSLQMDTYNFKKNNQITNNIAVNNIYSDYHNYGLLWTPNVIQILVDNDVYLSYNRNLYDTGNTTWKSWPFNEPFNIILNIAVGGTYGGEIDNNIFPQTMSIDSIKIYDLGLKDYQLNTVY